jgi:hypothetical protein
VVVEAVGKTQTLLTVVQVVVRGVSTVAVAQVLLYKALQEGRIVKTVVEVEEEAPLTRVEMVPVMLVEMVEMV